ncbi:MAG: signal peptidase II [Candidatus Nitrospinota bacterium M3_3B_026]
MSGAGFPGALLRLAPALAAGALIAADRVTKMIVEESIPLNGAVTVIPGLFNIVHIKNRGAAFGLLGGVESEWVSRGFTVVSISALVIITVLYRSLPPRDRAPRAALVFIGSGAFGNLIDRLKNGAVTDFLLFYIDGYQWPAFNVADSAITVGVMLLAWSLFTGGAHGEKQRG